VIVARQKLHPARLITRKIAPGDGTDTLEHMTQLRLLAPLLHHPGIYVYPKEISSNAERISPESPNKITKNVGSWISALHRDGYAQ
jgi:hypothetical protein